MLSINNISVSYGSIKALKGVSLSINDGEIVTVIGSNGAGKTTLVRAISGVLPLSSGNIEYEGACLSKTPAHHIVARGLVQVPEGRLIFQNLSVYENLELGAYARQEKFSFKDEVGQIFDLFPRLKERAKQPGGTLSGGEQQMLAIGRALMANPKILLLDEPSLGLAPNLVQQIFSSLLQIQKSKKMSLLIIEQDAILALKSSHRAYVLETGSVVLEGVSEDLLKNPEVKKAYLGLG